MPSFFPNFPLRLLPLGEAQLEQVKRTGWLPEAAFRTTPNTTKAR
jgi:hypothetical protein